MRYRILPYRQGSKGAKALAEALGGKVLKLQGSKYVWQPGDVVVNWGNTEQGAGWPDPIDFNQRATIKNASNKLFFFKLMKEAGLSDVIPRFWSNRDEIPDDVFENGAVVCRTVLAGHSGDGIVIAANRDELVSAPLYVEYVKKQDEYRVHVGRKLDYGQAVGETFAVIAVQQKKRRHDVPSESVNWKVRNHSNGFIYAREGVVAPDAVLAAARKALEASGLDFGAVDVIYNAQKGKAYVLEINTAPGLEGQTVIDYANFFRGA